jgi:hypothetical protein
MTNPCLAAGMVNLGTHVPNHRRKKKKLDSKSKIALKKW